MKKLLTLFLLALCTLARSQDWNQLPGILNNIHPPTFPSRDIIITNLGALTNGTGLSTTYIQKAIDSCNGLGGGRVIIPAGTFLTGAITMKSNVDLHISAGAILKFSTNTANYLPIVLTRFEGVECYNYSPFIYSYNAENIALTGSGTLNGQASNTYWWPWKNTGVTDNNLLNTMGDNNTPVDQRVFGSGHFLRPVFIQFYKSKNILIDSVTIINSPMWEINPVLSENITVQNVNINSHGVNNDGCNPECCKNVLISKCTFNTGDDCIAIKSGRNNDGRRINIPSENIVIQNCTMIDGHGGITMGSECSGGIKNVFAENCTLSSAQLTTALRIKTNSIRGGVIENICMRNCTVTQVSGQVIQIDMNYQEGDAGDYTPIVRNIVLENIISNKSLSVFDIRSYQRSPATDITIRNCSFNNSTNTGTLTNVCRMQVYNSFINGNVPLIPSAVAGFTEAERYSNKTSWGWSNVSTGYNGNGYMEVADSNNLISFTATRTTNEIDTLVVRYKNIDAVNKPCSIYVNGIPTGQFNFIPSPSTWQTEKKSIALVNGINTINLVALQDDSTYIDRFSMNFSNTCLCGGDTTFFNSGYYGNYTYQWQVNDGNGYSNISNDVIYARTNKDTMGIYLAPSSWYGKKYRCAINGGSFYSNEFELKIMNTWTGEINSAWETKGNWSCNKIPDANTDVIIRNNTTNKPIINSAAECRSLQLATPEIITINNNGSLLITAKPSN